MQRWRVPFGFLCGALFLVLAHPNALSMAVGGPISILGLGLRGWATGHIRKNAALATSGPYAHTRNPLYLGSLLIALGFTIATPPWWLGLLVVALFLGIYLPVMRVEAKTLEELFKEDYKRYANLVPLFFPRWVPFRDEATRDVKFDAGLYMRYREYQAAIGVVIAWALLILKAVFLKRYWT
jgi:protein-S-isoprenylcysteine O-methyltransferase Ste14